LRYARQLAGVAAKVDNILRSGQGPDAVMAALQKYGDFIEPWARKAAANMVLGVNRANVRAWESAGRKAGADLRLLPQGPGIGLAVRERIDANMALIQSLPWGERDEVAHLVSDALIKGQRAETIAREIETMPNISARRARVIARTEIGKAHSALTMARAAGVNSPGYIWRTTRDGGTRPSHRAMEGQFVPWNKPPVLDLMTGHAGEFPNCRCYAEPVIPNLVDGGVYKPPLPTAGEERRAGERRLLSVWESSEGAETMPHMPDTPLPNVDRAVYNDRKAADYALNLNSPHANARGHAKAFQMYLGLLRKDAELLKRQIMEQLPHLPAARGKSDTYGERFTARVPVTGPNGRRIDVLTGWIYEKGKYKTKIFTTPRLVTMYIDEEAVTAYEKTYPRV
jgi:SPP1 gp7 family putative phage head morphogenesis protein